MGTALFPVRTQYGLQYQRMEVQIDEALLKKISALTNGKYFRATNRQKLQEVYKEIDRLEKSKIDVTEFNRKKEEFMPFLIFALLLLTLEYVFRFAVLKLVP
jgi:Ca-activated chloride channel family protein